MQKSSDLQKNNFYGFNWYFFLQIVFTTSMWKSGIYKPRRTKEMVNDRVLLPADQKIIASDKTIEAI